MLVRVFQFRFTEYVGVPELDYLIKIPTGLSLPLAASLAAGSMSTYNVAMDLHERLQEFVRYSLKAVYVGDNCIRT